MIATTTTPLVESLPLEGTWQRVYELAVAVPAGAHVACYAEAEMTNYHPYLTGLWGRLASTLGGGPVAGQDLQPWCHGPMTKTLYLRASADTTLTVTLWAWAASAWAAAGDVVRVEGEGYGMLSVLVLPGLPAGLKAGLQAAAAAL